MTRSKLTANIAWNLVGQGSVLLLGIIGVRLIYSHLGQDALGIIYFTQTLNYVVCLILEGGVCSTTVRELSMSIGKDRRYVRQLVRTASLLYWSAYGLAAVIIWLCAPILVRHWLTLGMMEPSAAVHLLRVLGCSVILALPRSLYVSVFRGMQRMEIPNLVDTTSLGVQQIGIVAVLALGGGLSAVMHWIAGTYILGVLAYIVIASRFLTVRALVPGLDRKVLQKNWQYSRDMMFISLLGGLCTQADKAMISVLLPVREIGLYGFAYSMVSKGALFTNSVVQAALPSFSELLGAGSREAALVQYKKLQNTLCWVMLPVFAGLAFIAPVVLRFALDHDAAVRLFIPLLLLSFGFYLNAALYVPYVFSVADGRPRITVRSNLIAVVLVLPTAWALTHRFGLRGAAVTWVLYQLVGCVYGIPRIYSHCLHRSGRDWYRTTLQAFGLGFLVYGTAWAVAWRLGASASALVAAYFLGTCLFGFIGYRRLGDELRVGLGRVLPFRFGNAPGHLVRDNPQSPGCSWPKEAEEASLDRRWS